MRIFCDDCNCNIITIMELIKKIEISSNISEWVITKFEAVPIYTVDYSGVGYTLESPSQKLYEFSQRLLDNHEIVLTNLEFMSLLENIRSIYDADISFNVSGHTNKISIFDGDIIEISGFIETII